MATPRTVAYSKQSLLWCLIASGSILASEIAHAQSSCTTTFDGRRFLELSSEQEQEATQAYADTHTRILKICERRCKRHGLDAQTTEQISSEVSTGVWMRIRREFHKGAAPTHRQIDLYTHYESTNRLQALFKRLVRERSRESGVDVGGLTAEEPEELLRNRSEFKNSKLTLGDAISRLSARQRLIIVGYYFSSRSMADIARQVGVSREAIRESRDKALTKLKDILNQPANQKVSFQQLPLKGVPIARTRDRPACSLALVSWASVLAAC